MSSEDRHIEEPRHRVARIHFEHLLIGAHRRPEVAFHEVRESRHAAGQRRQRIDREQVIDQGPRERDSSGYQVAVAKQVERIRVVRIDLMRRFQIADGFLDPAVRIMNPATQLYP